MLFRYLRLFCMLFLVTLALTVYQTLDGEAIELPPVLVAATSTPGANVATPDIPSTVTSIEITPSVTITLVIEAKPTLGPASGFPVTPEVPKVSATQATTKTVVNWFQVLGATSEVIFSPDEHTVAIYPTGSPTSTVSLADVATGEIRRELRGAGAVASFSPDGRMILTTGGRLWDVASGTVIHILGPGESSFSPDGQIIATTNGESVRVWDTASGRDLFSVNGALGAIVPNRELVVTFSIQDKVRFWNVSTQKEIRALSGDSALMSPDKRSFVILNTTQSVTLTNISPGITVYDSITSREVIFFMEGESLIYSPSGNLIAVVRAGFTDIWDIRIGQRVRSLEGNGATSWPQPISRLFSPDERLVITSLRDEIHLWDLTTGEKVASFQGQAGQFSPDGQRLAIFSGSGTSIWSLKTGSKVAIPDQQVQFTPHGQYVFSRNSEVINLWDATTGDNAGEIPLMAAFSLDNRCSSTFNVTFSQSGSEAYITTYTIRCFSPARWCSSHLIAGRIRILCWGSRKENNSAGGTDPLRVFRHKNTKASNTKAPYAE